MIGREEARRAFTGPIASVCTPFREDGAIDYEGLRTFVDFVIAAGSKAVVLTSGDSLYTILTDDEVAELTKVVVECTAGRALVVAADRQWATGKELQFAKYVRDAGADVLMVMPPDWANSCTEESMTDHYAAVAKEIPVMVVTNVFTNRPVDFTLRTLNMFYDRSDGFVGIKDDLGSRLIMSLGLEFHDRVPIFSSNARTKHDYLAASPCGCDGFLSNFIMFRPDISRRFWEAARSGKKSEALRITEEYEAPFVQVLSQLEGGMDAGIHGTLELFGIAQRWRRKPYASLGDADMEKLRHFFKTKSLL